jgi:hypothetical protein
MQKNHDARAADRGGEALHDGRNDRSGRPVAGRRPGALPDIWHGADLSGAAH